MALFPLPLFILTIGIYFRYPWAFWSLALVMIIQLAAIFASAVVSVEAFVSTFVYLGPLYFVYGWILYILLRSWPDFERRKLRRLASVANNMNGPYELDKAAQQLADKGQWASAILHWRRAVGEHWWEWLLSMAPGQCLRKARLLRTSD